MEKLGSLCRFLNGGTPSKVVESHFQGDIPWITSADITSPIANDARSFITEAAIENSATNKVEKGTVLLVTRTGVGKVAIAGRALCFSQDITAILPNSARLDSGYLVHFLKTKQSHFDRYARGATIKGVTREVVTDLEIPLPPLPEQRRIAAILDKADALRSKRREALAKLDRLAQSIFVEMFGNPVTNPKGWPQVNLGELIASGPQNGLYKPVSDYGSGAPILRIDAFYDGAVTGLATLKRLRVDAKEMALYGLHEDDIVINRVNSPEYLGKSALIPPLSEPVVFESNMMRFALKTERIVPRYAISFLQTGFIKTQIRTASKDAVNQSSINQQDVKSFLINLPPISLQQTFAERLVEIEALRSFHAAASIATAQLFTSIQHRAFRGEL